MSEVEKKLEGVLTEYAKMDDDLNDMYVRLRELDTISESYNKTKSSLESSSGNLKATSEALIAEIEILKDLANKLGNSQITTFNTKLDSFALATNAKLDSFALATNAKFDSFALATNAKLDSFALATNAKFDSFETALKKQQELLYKSRVMSIAILGLVSVAAIYSLL